jgi:IrrE N-terminal-like domain
MARSYFSGKQKRSHPVFVGNLAWQFCASVDSAVDPIDAAKKRATRLVTESGIREPPFRPALYGSLCNVQEIVQKRMEIDGRLIPTSRGFKIELRKDRPHVRKNFTCAHEIAHTFFYEAAPALKAFDIQDREEEFLCNVAAAELLMPAVTFKRIAAEFEVSATSVLEISQLFETSVTSTVVRLGDLGIWGAKFILWDCKDPVPVARWLATPSRPLSYFPKLGFEDDANSGLRKVIETGTPTLTEEWLFFDNRFLRCRIDSIILPGSRALSCIAPLTLRKLSKKNLSKTIDALPLQFKCRCFGTGSVIIETEGLSYALPCRASQHNHR